MRFAKNFEFLKLNNPVTLRLLTISTGPKMIILDSEFLF